LLDAVATMIGLRKAVKLEGRAAIELEASIPPATTRPVSIGSRRSGPMRIDLRPEGARHLHQRTNSEWPKKTARLSGFRDVFRSGSAAR
jgi:hydrogenase maturation factor HypF (carbamoyltransferase family)